MPGAPRGPRHPTPRSRRFRHTRAARRGARAVASAGARPPAQIRPQLAIGDQTPDAAEPRVNRALQVLEPQAGGDIGVVQLARATPRVPAQLEPGERALETPAVDAVRAQVRARPRRDLDHGAGYSLGDDL